MNADGGYLLIGINNNRGDVGVEGDYRPPKNAPSNKEDLHYLKRDEYKRRITQRIKGFIGTERFHLVGIDIIHYKQRDICRINVKQSPKPVYSKKDGAFYVRDGESTEELSPLETNNYVKDNWGVEFL